MNKARTPLPSHSLPQWWLSIEHLLLQRLSGWEAAYLALQNSDLPAQSPLQHDELAELLVKQNSPTNELLLQISNILAKQAWMSWRARRDHHHWNPLLQSFTDFSKSFPDPICYIEITEHNRVVREQQLLGWLVQLTLPARDHE